MLRVVDAIGRVSPVTEQRTIIVDVTAPAASLLAPVLTAAYDTGVPGDNVTTTQDITFTSNESGLKESTARSCSSTT